MIRLNTDGHRANGIATFLELYAPNEMTLPTPLNIEIHVRRNMYGERVEEDEHESARVRE